MLAIDIDGNIAIIELKKKRTPRDVVAQIIDYASWVQRLSYKGIENFFKNNNSNSLEEAFVEKFGVPLPEELNMLHEMIIVSVELDHATERIVQYLSSNYDVPINAVFFRYFIDGNNEYISRSWLIDSHDLEKSSAQSIKKDSWNRRDFVVNFGEGENRSWEDARKYGFISAGNG